MASLVGLVDIVFPVSPLCYHRVLSPRSFDDGICIVCRILAILVEVVSSRSQWVADSFRRVASVGPIGCNLLSWLHSQVLLARVCFVVLP